jgi:putative copper export protein
MLTPDLDTLRLGLHLFAATVWVGGQIVLLALLPVLRKAGGDTPRAAARAWNRIAWPAFAVLVATGVWNLTEVAFGDRETDYQVTVFVKLLVVATSGTAAAVHSLTKSRPVLAVTGALGGLAALGAFALGVLLRS